MMKYNFTLRILPPKEWMDFRFITLSNITLISKPTKFDPPCLYKGNQKKFNYKMTVNTKRILRVAGSNSYPVLGFKGKYLDIEIENFPRFPVLGQDYYDARSFMNEWNNVIGDGFDHLNFEILNLKCNDNKNNEESLL